MTGREDGGRRNSKLESFLKRNLHPNVYNNIRWYEAVVVRTAAGLEYRQCVVTGDALFLTDTPPRTLTRLLSHPQLSHVSLVHDLPEFLRGGIRDRTTHIKLRYRTRRSKNASNAGRKNTVGKNKLRDAISEEGEVAQEGNVPNEGGIPDESDAASLYSQSSEPSSQNSCNQADNLSFSGIRRRKEWKRSSPCSSHESVMSPSSSHLTFMTNHNLLSPLNGAKSPVRPRSPEDEDLFHSRPSTPTIAELLNSGRPLTRPSTPDSISRAKMPRSQSALETYHRSSFLHLELPTRSKSVLDKPVAKIQEPPRRSQSLNFTDTIDGEDAEEEVHLYTLSTSTLLFHLLHSLWLSSTLRWTKRGGRLHILPLDEQHERPLDSAFRQLRAEILAAKALEDQFSLLQELQQGATKYSTIRRLFWKNGDLLSTLCGNVHKLAQSCPDSGGHDDDLQLRQDELEMMVLVLETLSSCLQGTQRCPYKMKMLQKNDYEHLRSLVLVVMAPPEVPHHHHLTCSHWLHDFRDLASDAWENLPEGELLKLLQEVTHTSAACLYEVLNTVQEFLLTPPGSSDSEGRAVPLSIATLIQRAPVEAWLTRAVPQLLSLLQPDRNTTATGEEAVLIFQYCSVLKLLLQHSPKALKFCTTKFSEELRYYAHEAVVGYRLTESSPLHDNTLRLVRALSQQLNTKTSSDISGS
ncbi:uncharacterized protein C12orf56-like [Oratosquilla oratoria]|uniref:uncharacterized protein C12orf56-like n=1 Tax=Oratosquilla oratoria TaxID=337810 RepID=UPI003F771753